MVAWLRVNVPDCRDFLSLLIQNRKRPRSPPKCYSCGYQAQSLSSGIQCMNFNVRHAKEIISPIEIFYHLILQESSWIEREGTSLDDLQRILNFTGNVAALTYCLMWTSWQLGAILDIIGSKDRTLVTPSLFWLNYGVTSFQEQCSWYWYQKLWATDCVVRAQPLRDGVLLFQSKL